MPAGASRPGSTRDYRLPLAVSFLLHAAVLVAVGRAPWPSADVPGRDVLRVVWLGDRVTSAVEAPRESLEAAVPPRVEPPASEPPPSAPPPDQRPLVEPARLPAPSPAPPPAPEPDAPAPPDRATRGRLVAPGGVFERAHRAGIAETVERLERENDYVKFGDEAFPEEPVAEAPNPRAEMFDSPSRRNRGGAALQPGRGRSHFANRVAELCNALSGGGIGFGLFGLGGTLCAEAGAGADFFADLRPAYMESLPVCAESTPERPELAALAPQFPTMKCRLVPKDERPGTPLLP